MKVMLNGKEVKCHSFSDLKPGDVFTYCGNRSAYIKTNGNQCFNVCGGALENYSGLPVVPYPNAVLVLDGDDDE